SEGLAVVARNGHLHLLGQSPSATAWAVWDWLESKGVRFLLPVAKGEYVPTVDRLSFAPDLAKYDAPALRFRGPGYNLPMDLDASPLIHEQAGQYTQAKLFDLRHRNNYNIGLAPGDGTIGI